LMRQHVARKRATWMATKPKSSEKMLLSV